MIMGGKNDGRTKLGLEMPKKYVCRHCKVEVLGKTDPRAVLGKVHKKSCPRSK